MDIALKSLRKAYGANVVLDQYSAVFPQGSITAIMAPSGTGKTTLLRLLLKLEKPDSGEILGVPERKSALFQEDRLCLHLSALDNIRITAGKQFSRDQIVGLLTELGLRDGMDLPASQLSGGMARRAALARALLYDGQLLILDEPFNGLDEENRRIAAQVIRKYLASRTLIFVTHRKEDAELLGAERMITLV